MPHRPYRGTRPHHHSIIPSYRPELDRRILLYSGPDRTDESLEAFFDTYGTDHLQEVTLVCCDMWKPYVNVIKRRLSHAMIVYDKFHLVRHLLSAIDTVRRQEAQELLDQTLLKKTKYIILKNQEYLTEKQNLRLTELLAWNLKSVRAYLLKESLRELWVCRSRQAAQRCLRQWCWMATHWRLTPLRDRAFFSLLRRFCFGASTMLASMIEPVFISRPACASTA